MPDLVTTGPGGHEPGPRPLLRTALGNELRRVRQAQGRTLSEVAQAARVSMPYLSELERGRKEGSSEVLAAICDALAIELGDLLTEVGHRLAKEAGLARKLTLADRSNLARRTSLGERASVAGADSVAAASVLAEQTSLAEDTGRHGTVVELDTFRARRAARPGRAAGPRRPTPSRHGSDEVRWLRAA